MCGIAGFLSPHNKDDVYNVANNMIKELIHRGPDAGNVWADETLGIALGSRRLSILDLSESGSQPMKSLDKRYVLVYNGEIYNHTALRKSLDSHNIQWRGTSDTETLLESIAHIGLHRTLHYVNGMFAFALWDIEKKKLYLCRDRMGEKPLYYGIEGRKLIFASELKAIIKEPKWNVAIRRKGILELINFGYIPSPNTILQNIHKVPPANVVEFDYESFSAKPPEKYWDIDELVYNGLENPITEQSHEEKINKLQEILSDSVRKRMISDVPIGAFLSGGFDSSIITALMQKQSDKPIKTFSIGFEEKGYDESEFAKEISDSIGTDHKNYIVTKKDLLDIVPKLPILYDEPFADSSCIPTYIVSKLAKKEVTVVLSGDGGDELFAGYNRHFAGPAMWSKLKKIPYPVRCLVSKIMNIVPARTQMKTVRMLYPKSKKLPHLDEKILKVQRMMTCKNDNEVAIALVRFADSSIVKGNRKKKEPAIQKFKGDFDSTYSMIYSDLVRTLPGDMLVKVDRASMGCSLEVRVPFLDPELVSFAWKLPIEDKMADGEGKKIVKDLGYRLLSKELLDRPKKGFQVPIDEWLRTDLKEWTENLLNHEKLTEEGFFHADKVSRLFNEHLSGKRNHKNELWAVCMFQAWFDEYKNYIGTKV